VHAGRNQVDGKVVLRIGEELAAVLLKPSLLVVATGAEKLDVRGQALGDRIVNVHAMAGP